MEKYENLCKNIQKYGNFVKILKNMRKYGNNAKK